MISRNYLALLAVGAGLFAGGPVMAADYDPPIFVDDAAEDYVPVEVGSGWYLRGDLAYTFDRGYNDTTFYTDGRTIDQDMASPARLGPLSINGFDVKENPVSGGVGFGYHFTDYLRGDLNFGLMGNDRFDADGRLFADTANAPPEFGCAGTQRTTVTDNASGASTVSVDPLARRDCAVTASGSVKAYNGMANGYVDLGTYSGLTPYIGAGVGMLYTRTKLDVNALCQTEDIAIDDGFATTRSQFLCQSPGGQPTNASQVYTPVQFDTSEYNFMYSVNAGLAYKVSLNTSIDVGYQYLNVPSIRYYSVSDAGIDVSKGFDAHQVKVGLRYDLW
ncbi:MAG TPA: outer membrane beta-barrel protein [Mesorhizobium sp.]